MLNTCRQLGGALAVAVFGALVANPATFLPGLQVSLVVAALVLLVAAGGSLTLRARPEGGRVEARAVVEAGGYRAMGGRRAGKALLVP